MYKNIKILAKLYYQRMWAEHSGEQISEGDLTSVALYSFTTACQSTAALLQTDTSTSMLTLHRHFLSVRYLRGHLFRCAWAVTEQNDRVGYWTERHAEQWWQLRERGILNTAGQCGIYFWLQIIQCIPSNWTKRFIEANNLPQFFLYSSYSRNRFSPKKVNDILFPNVILILSPKVASYLTNETQG